MAGEPASPTFHGPDPHGTELARTLADRLDGDVRADAYTRHLYATDASLYRELPVVVVFPAGRRDVVTTVEACADRGVPVLPRGGGTSLAGQTVNEAVVLDFTRHMDRLRSVDADAKRATVQPGLVLDALDRQVADLGLQFAPDPASAQRATIGGGIGNNSAGAHSPAYGPTDAHLESVEVVLADGTVATFGPTTPEAIAERADEPGILGDIYATVDRFRSEERSTIDAAYPHLGRNVAGYTLDALLEPDDDGRINLARLIAGSEGTLGVITEATVDLVELPPVVGAALLTYDDFVDAMADVGAILEHDVAAVETIDAPLLEKARKHPSFAESAAVVPETASGMLLVEVFGEEEPSVERTLTELAEEFGQPAGQAIDVQTTTDDDERARYWHLRKSALPLMMSETTDEKHPAVVEDTAVPPEHLASFVEGFQALLDEHGTFASFYGHAGAGVLHVRPLIDVTSIEGREMMRSLADGAFELVMAHGGSVSGEHGDGRVRTEWTKRQYGPAVVGLFEELKGTFDPDGLLNPGPITGDVAIEAGQRVDPEAPVELPFEPALAWENANGFEGMVDLCHGCGGCRTDQAVGGVMCPTFRATDEEIASTRGRANLLREAMRGHLPPATLFDPRFEAEVLDLCIGCKGCLHDCPSGVDLATLKAELRHQRHRRRGATRRERALAAFPRLAKWGSITAPFSNWAAGGPLARRLLAETMGLHPARPPPRFASTSFTAWADGRLPATPSRAAANRAIIVPDPYTNYLEPEVGRATVALLEAAGVSVTVRGDLPPPGRAAYSQGFVDQARNQARETIDALGPAVDEGWDIVVPEPSAAAMFQSDYAHLVGSDDAAPLAAATHTPVAYLAAIEAEVPVDPPATPVTVHDHCHQHALGRGGIVGGVLEDHGFAVETVDSGCCGMAGSFGYEREHYDLSRSIADILLEQLDELGAERVLATGTSCRAQLEHVDDRPVIHPAVELAAHLDD